MEKPYFWPIKIHWIYRKKPFGLSIQDLEPTFHCGFNASPAACGPFATFCVRDLQVHRSAQRLCGFVARLVDLELEI